MKDSVNKDNTITIINGEVNNKNIILDNGYFFGQGAFETILVKNKPCFLNEHLSRLNESLKVLNINKKIEKNYVLENIEKIKLKNYALKISVSEKNIIFTTRNIPYSEQNYADGFTLKISNIRRNHHSHTTYIKSFNYSDNLIERKMAINEGYDEVIFLNNNNYICEGSATNLFFIINNTIYTPSIECGLLNGVVRQWIIKNYKVIEGKFKFDKIIKSDEIFVTNSLLGIMKVNSIETIKYNKCKILNNIRNDYESYLEEIGG